MLSEKQMHADVRSLLLDNRPFKYAHLVKFERPSRPDARSGKISTSAQRYVYITDASRDVIFDDLSRNLQGELNNPQNYIANKLLSVSPIQEADRAKADTANITLDGNSIGAVATATVTITAVDANFTDIRFPDTVDLLEIGFRTGDKVVLSGARTGAYNIFKFRENNTVRIGNVDTAAPAPGTVSLTITQSSEEIVSILLNKDSSDYASFINREVYIYRAYFDENGMVGENPDPFGNLGPILLFRGIISGVSFEEDDSGIKVSWGLTSHWGDFSQVRGRITSDEFHRAIDQSGNPQPESAIKTIYAYDKGFAHSETSINLLANYTVLVDKTTVTAKNGFFGIGAKTKVKTVPVPEQRATNLDFQLQAKSIPVIYGVRVTTGSPIFADTHKTNSSEVYVVYALSEGQIGGLYDVIIEGKSLICNNKEDFDSRSVQKEDNTVDLVCRGRADRGDVLGGTRSMSNVSEDFYTNITGQYSLEFNRNSLRTYNRYVVPTSASDSAIGVIHGESIALTSPQSITLDFFSGTETQRAASQLVEIAKNNNFKVQSDYWLGDDTAEYWGPNHRLLDTAYVVAKYIIKEGETSIPSLDFVVRGAVLPCYNYDYSFSHDQKMTLESPNNFFLGDMVTLSTGQSVQIIDKWSFVQANGLIETRFRFSTVPNLQYNNGIPAVTRFTMTKGASVWTMTTYNWELTSGTVSATQAVPAVVTNPPTETDPNITVTFPPTTFTGGGSTDPNITGRNGGGVTQHDVALSIVEGTNVMKNAILYGNLTSTSLTTQGS